jgi:hypothetical protein
MRVHTQLLSHNSQWGNGEKTSFCWQPSTRLTGPITPACDRYVQYLLMGSNPSVLQRHRWGLQPWRYRLFTYHSSIFTTDSLPFSPIGPAQSPFYPKSINYIRVYVLKGPMAATWSFNHSAIYRNLQLRLAIANDLSLAIGSTRVDWKVSLMQLWPQFNSYNLMHNQES